MKLRHIGITVTNMEKSLKLYRDYFGFKVVWDELERGEFIDNLSAEKDVRVRTVKMKDESGGMIELLYYYSHPENNAENLTNKIMKIGCSHFALTVDDLDKVYGELKDIPYPEVEAAEEGDEAAVERMKKSYLSGF